MTTVTGSVWDERKNQLVVVNKKSALWINLNTVGLLTDCDG